jgi:hypothetical protein
MNQFDSFVNSILGEESLHDWFSHKSGGKPGWVDCKTKKPCGRQKGEKRKSYPACRPTLSQCNSSMKKKKSSKRISWKSKKKK